MNDLRSSLIDTIQKVLYRCCLADCSECELLDNEHCTEELIADALLAEGWVRQEWRDAVSSPPTDEELLDDQEFLVMIQGGANATSLFYVDGEWQDEAQNAYKVTHWMPLPLPLPPKGE